MAMAGTRHWPSLQGCVLLLEDTLEAPYRLDRLLTQLMQATAGLHGVAGVALGRFTDCLDPQKGYLPADTLRSFFSRAPFPVVWELPVGHAQPNHALPHGAPVALDASAGTLTLLD
jgi:muramoyltetrapeptide carboxypeptidase